MLAHEMLVLNILGRRHGIRCDLNRIQRHFCNFLKHDSMINCFCRVFSPGKRAVIPANYARHVRRIERARIKRFADDATSIQLVTGFNLFRRERPRAGNGAVKVIRVRSAVTGNVAPRLRPGDCVRAVRVNDSAD